MGKEKIFSSEGSGDGNLALKQNRALMGIMGLGKVLQAGRIKAAGFLHQKRTSLGRRLMGK